MIRVLFYRVVLAVTISIQFFILDALNIESCTRWVEALQETEGRRMRQLLKERMMSRSLLNGKSGRGSYCRAEE